MSLQSPPEGGLVVLAEAFRSKRTGTLVLGDEPGALRVRVERGQVVALGPPPAEAAAASLPKPNDSVRLRLERVLSEIGMRKPAASPEPPAPASLRDRVIDRLGEESVPVRFEEEGEAATGLVAVAVATEPLILEAVRQLRDDAAVRRALGDLDQRLIATGALADERTLTVTEGYLLSRIDGLISARDVLQLVPLDPRETERSLLGLVLTGRVERRPAAPSAQPERAEPAPPEPAAAPPIPSEPVPLEPLPVGPLFAEPVAARPAPVPPLPAAVTAEPGSEPAARTATAPPPAAEAHVGVAEGGELAGGEEVIETSADEVEDPDPGLIVEAVPDDEPEAVVAAAADAPTVSMPALPAREPLDPKVAERRREIVAFYQSLPFKQTHFDMLGLEPGCSDEEAKRAYVTLTKRYHPDANRDRRLDDLHDMLEAIIIRVGEAWEVIGEARSRASYESRAGIVRRPRPAAPAAPAAPSSGPAAPAPPHPPSAAYPSPEDEAPGGYVPPEEILQRARRLLAQADYWSAIQLLETALPGMEPPRQQHRGRLLLARAYSKNPNWLRRAEEMLQALVREDPTNADTHFELGLVYKTGGFHARASAMFRRALELRPGHKEASAELGIQPAEPEGGGGLLKRLFKRGKAS